MKIYTSISLVWDGRKYVTDEEQSFDYSGPVAMCCGATAAQTQIQGQQQTAYQTMTTQAAQVFGASSAVFNDLQSTFAPTVAAGPSQQGFSPAELSNLNSNAITTTGNAYRNAKSAVGEAESAQGGGNISNVSGGAKTATDLGIATSAAGQTAGELNQIGEADYATGRQNYDTAVAGLAGAPGVFNPATGAGSAATASGSAAANTANQIATQSNSWVQAVTGALGGVIGDVATGGLKNLGAGVGFFGGKKSQPSNSGSSFDDTE